MKTLKRLAAFFAGVGVILLGAAYMSYRHTAGFIEESVTATGTVIELDLSRSRGSSSSGGTYHPVIRFKTEGGESIEFRAGLGSNPPSYARGEQVRVRYRPDDPYRARIDTYFALWWVCFLLAGMGVLFSGTGTVLLLVLGRSDRRDQWLRQFGQSVTTQIQSVERDMHVRIRSGHPFRIVSQWHDPVSNSVRVFRSKTIGFDPSPYVHGDSIAVLIDPQDPSQYLMDTSFLPEKAG